MMIDGVKVKKLRVIPDERGRLMEILRSDDEIFQQFGQVYMTTTYPNVVKAWHLHKIQTDNVAVVRGMLKLVLLVQIPPGVYHGWMCISETEAVAVNCPTEPYNRGKPDEYRLPPHGNDIPYQWQRKDG